MREWGKQSSIVLGQGLQSLGSERSVGQGGGKTPRHVMLLG